MVERQYIFPGVIEMNVQARRRLGVNIYLIDGGGEYALIDVGFLDELKGGRVRVRPAVARFTESGVVFSDGTSGDYDAVVAATGFTTGLEDLLADAAHSTAGCRATTAPRTQACTSSASTNRREARSSRRTVTRGGSHGSSTPTSPRRRPRACRGEPIALALNKRRTFQP